MTARRARTVQVQPHQTCPLCRDTLLEPQPETLGVCPGCGTLYHDACANELGGCGVLGCTRSRPDSEPREPSRVEPDAGRRVFTALLMGGMLLAFVGKSLGEPGGGLLALGAVLAILGALCSLPD